MRAATVQVHLTLAADLARKLREMARVHGVTEETVVEQALDLLFGLDDTPVLADYWFSVAAMREDWKVMPEDWMADEVMGE
jgi:hypothetical protein